ncbi:MAG: PIG-L family deacetylase, partial [Ferruginibacter sp.]
IKPVADLMDNIDVSVNRLSSTQILKGEFDVLTNKIKTTFNFSNPSQSIPDLLALHKVAVVLKDTGFAKANDVARLIAMAGGVFMEATAVNQLNTIGDSAKFNLVINNRSGIAINSAQVTMLGNLIKFDSIEKNVNAVKQLTTFIGKQMPATQPYWLQQPMDKGHFTVNEQWLIGNAEVNEINALFQLNIGGEIYLYNLPVQYKFTDPVLGELYQPVQFVNPFFVNTSPSLVLIKNQKEEAAQVITYTLQPNLNLKDRIIIKPAGGGAKYVVKDSVMQLTKGKKILVARVVQTDDVSQNANILINGEATAASLNEKQNKSLRHINYSHIPDIFYNYVDYTRILSLNLKVAGSKAGFIAGAGDKIPDALQQMGYTVTILQEGDVSLKLLQQFDVIITGVRAYNIHSWLSNVHSTLMEYVKTGGVLVVQYNTNNSIGPIKANISPYPFTISRSRVTDENAAVHFLIPDHPVLNFPNKITAADFDGWIQERSIYHAENIDSNYQRIFSLNDEGEKPHDGSLIITNYGKGKFVYTGIAFFRELPAGVPGAFRLFANVIAKQP